MEKKQKSSIIIKMLNPKEMLQIKNRNINTKEIIEIKKSPE